MNRRGKRYSRKLRIECQQDIMTRMVLDGASDALSFALNRSPECTNTVFLAMIISQMRQMDTYARILPRFAPDMRYTEGFILSAIGGNEEDIKKFLSSNRETDFILPGAQVLSLWSRDDNCQKVIDMLREFPNICLQFEMEDFPLSNQQSPALRQLSSCTSKGGHSGNNDSAMFDSKRLKINQFDFTSGSYHEREKFRERSSGKSTSTSRE
ncbi:hypothetical protein F5Y16DRAFT_103469 [Xylariaceae sp. FL0255]|nr:hypothetical protein F5Y16DRAFT_103469 [Xylariaceae sp. FL0255]